MEKEKSKNPARTVITTVCRIQKNEKVLIIANPETAEIAQQLYDEADSAGAAPVLVYQKEKKTTADATEPAVLAAIKTEPDVIFSISQSRLGKDPGAIEFPYTGSDGTIYDSTFDYLLYGKKVIRAVWTPGITQDMFNRTVDIDYIELKNRCHLLSSRYKDAVSVRVTTNAGTDVTVAVAGRNPLSDDGDFSQPGSGGNIPAGEVFISPVVGKTSGIIVYDGSIALPDTTLLLQTPITVHIDQGFITDIQGGKEADQVLQTITDAENQALELEKQKALPQGQGTVYARNARGIGELGIGLNPCAAVTGNMLEDEKAFHTCHFAIGANYDNDGPALIHLDGVVCNPSIVITYKDGSMYEIMHEGELKL